MFTKSGDRHERSEFRLLDDFHDYRVVDFPAITDLVQSLGQLPKDEFRPVCRAASFFFPIASKGEAGEQQARDGDAGLFAGVLQLADASLGHRDSCRPSRLAVKRKACLLEGINDLGQRFGQRRLDDLARRGRRLCPSWLSASFAASPAGHKRGIALPVSSELHRL